MSVEVKGLDKLEKKFARLGKDLKPEMAQTMDKAMKYVHGEVPPYPPPIEGSKYKRKRSAGIGGSINTEVKTIGADVVGVIGSNIEYAPWVISSEDVNGIGPQARIHEGRWWTLQKVVEDAKEGIVEIFNKAIAKLLAE